MEDKLNSVDSSLADKIRKILVAMGALGFPMKVIQGLRTAEYQHELWLQGRAPDGTIIDSKKIVTQVDGFVKKSNHQSGRAVDCAFIDEHGKVTFDEHLPWDLYGMMGHSLGLIWGGAWKFVDMGHLELP